MSAAAAVARASYRADGQANTPARVDVSAPVTPITLQILTLLIAHPRQLQRSLPLYVAEALETFAREAFEDITGRRFGEIYERMQRGERFVWTRVADHDYELRAVQQ